MDEPATIGIGDLAAAASLKPTTIRYYESLGLVAPVSRASGRRRFDAAAVRRLKVVAVLKTAGFGLDEIRQLVEPATSDPQLRSNLVRRRLRAVQSSIRQLQAVETALVATIDCGCASIEHCDLINTHGRCCGEARDHTASSR